ncbi:MAG: DUF4286 family protein [Bernardetiaceae bacterium]
MLIYNVTINIDEDIHTDWLQWMQTEHIPEVMNTGLFVQHRILRLLTPLPETKGPTYAVQYYCHSQQQLDRYQTAHAPRLQHAHNLRYANKFVAFRTVLEVVEKG